MATHRRRPVLDIGDVTEGASNGPHSGREEDGDKACQDAPLGAEELRQLVRHPRMASLEIHAAAGTATLRQREVIVSLPMSEFRARLRGWGWQGENCHRPLLLFGDDDEEVRKAHAVLREEGFTAAHNARTREALRAALRRPPAHLRGGDAAAAERD